MSLAGISDLDLALWAVAQNAIDKSRAGDGPSELKICEMFAALMEGRPFREGEHIVKNGVTYVARAASGAKRPIPMVHRRWDKAEPHQKAGLLAQKPHPSVKGPWPWRERNEFRAIADRLRSRLRRLGKLSELPETDPNRLLWSGFKIILGLCQEAPWREEYAASVADRIGRRSYFEKRVRPVMCRRAACRSAGLDEFDMTMLDLFDLLAPAPDAADAVSPEPAPRPLLSGFQT